MRALLIGLFVVGCGGRETRKPAAPDTSRGTQPPCGIPSSEENPWPCGAPEGVETKPAEPPAPAETTVPAQESSDATQATKTYHGCGIPASVANPDPCGRTPPVKPGPAPKSP